MSLRALSKFIRRKTTPKIFKNNNTETACTLVWCYIIQEMGDAVTVMVGTMAAYISSHNW